MGCRLERKSTKNAFLKPSVLWAVEAQFHVGTWGNGVETSRNSESQHYLLVEGTSRGGGLLFIPWHLHPVLPTGSFPASVKAFRQRNTDPAVERKPVSAGSSFGSPVPLLGTWLQVRHWTSLYLVSGGFVCLFFSSENWAWKLHLHHKMIKWAGVCKVLRTAPGHMVGVQ